MRPGSTGSDGHEVEREGRSIELEFRLTDDAVFFVRASGEAGCRVTMEDMVHRTDGRQLEYVTVETAAPDRVLAAAAATPGIEDLVEQYPEFTVAKIDAGENEAAMDDFGVQSIPTMILFERGEPVEVFAGKVPYPKLERAVRAHT